MSAASEQLFISFHHFFHVASVTYWIRLGKILRERNHCCVVLNHGFQSIFPTHWVAARCLSASQNQCHSWGSWEVAFTGCALSPPPKQQEHSELHNAQILRGGGERYLAKDYSPCLFNSSPWNRWPMYRWLPKNSMVDLSMAMLNNQMVS